MDTREKIVRLNDVPALLQCGDWLAVAGLFDPLTAVQAKRLADLRDGYSRKVLAIVLDTEDTLLTAEARAVLIAALREVDLVTTAEPESWRSTIASNDQTDHVQILEDAEGEQRRCAEFVQFILRRQESA